MLYRTIKIKFVFLLMGLQLFYISSAAQSDGLTSGLEVYIPFYSERFDWSLNYGGNDGGSSLEDYTQEALSAENATFSDCKHGYQCLEVGAGNTVGKFKVKTKTKEKVFFTFRVMLYNSKPFKITINNKSYDPTVIDAPSYLRGSLSGAEELFISAKEKNNVRNFYLDDVFLYSLSKDKAELSKASRLLVVGELDEAMLKELQEIVAANDNLTSLDLNSASLKAGVNKVELTSGNPNCLIYDPYCSIVTNTHNVVKTKSSSTKKYDMINDCECDNLVIKDGYPFDAMYSFTAKNASYDRTFNNTESGYMSTVCLPFTVEKSQTGMRNIYGFTEYKSENSSLSFASSDKIEACKPYVVEVASQNPFADLHNVFVYGTSPLDIFKCRKGISTPELKKNKKYRFHGTFSGKSNVKSSETQTVYGFQGGKFVYVGAEEGDAVSFKPFRAYFTIDKEASQSASRELVLDGVISGVESVKIDALEKRQDVYNTEGVRVNSNVDSATLHNLPNGIYIIGGKKVMVRH